MNEFLEELSSQHLSFLSKYEKSQSQHFFEAKELNLSLKNHHNQKKTSLKLQIHHLECQTTLQSKEIEQKNLLITELRKSFEEHLKVCLFSLI